MNAERVWWVADGAAQAPGDHVTTDVAVPTTEPPRFALRVGALIGGRRLLSDDGFNIGALYAGDRTPFPLGPRRPSAALADLEAEFAP